MKTKKAGIVVDGYMGTWRVVDTKEFGGDNELWLLEQEPYESDTWHEAGPTHIITSYGADKVIVADAANRWADLPNKYAIEFKLNGHLVHSLYGGGSLIYIMRDGSTVCADCASKHLADIDTRGGYFEGETIECDGGCGTMIEAAYGNPWADDEDLVD